MLAFCRLKICIRETAACPRESMVARGSDGLLFIHALTDKHFDYIDRFAAYLIWKSLVAGRIVFVSVRHGFDLQSILGKPAAFRKATVFAV
jgi:hypothetical protein